MITGLRKTAEISAMIKALKDAKITVKEQKDSQGHVASASVKGQRVFWAMSHSSGKHYLVRYVDDLFNAN